MTFSEIWPRVESLTLLDEYKARLVHDLVEASPPAGDVAECGVFRGGITAMMALQIDKTKRATWAFDSFQGLPESRSDKDTKHYQAGHMIHSEIALHNTLCALGIVDRVRVVSGLFEQILPDRVPRLGLVHVDSDLYDSTRICIEKLHGLVLPGGFMVFDDYFDQGGGVAAAVNEHVARTSEQLYAGYGSQVFLVKDRTWREYAGGDPRQPWTPPLPRKCVKTWDDVVVDASIPCSNKEYQLALVRGEVIPELPGRTLVDAQRIADRILAACRFHMSVLEERS